MWYNNYVNIFDFSAKWQEGSKCMVTYYGLNGEKYDATDYSKDLDIIACSGMVSNRMVEDAQERISRFENDKNPLIPDSYWEVPRSKVIKTLVWGFSVLSICGVGFMALINLIN